MLAPKRVKHRKQQKGRMGGVAFTGSSISFVDYGLKALECGYLDFIESACGDHSSRSAQDVDQDLSGQAHQQEAR